jgi:hypothetical protein
MLDGDTKSNRMLRGITDQAAQRSCSQILYPTCSSDSQKQTPRTSFPRTLDLALVNIIGGSLLLVLQVNTMLH